MAERVGLWMAALLLACSASGAGLEMRVAAQSAGAPQGVAAGVSGGVAGGAPGGVSGGIPATVSQATVTLEAHDGRTRFLLGDPVRLDLVFRDLAFPHPVEQNAGGNRGLLHFGTRPGQATVNVTDYNDLADQIEISPAEGWFLWRGPSGHDYLTATPLDAEEVRVGLQLSEGIVFEKPGHYEIRVRTHRLHLPGQAWSPEGMETNAVGIDIGARSAEDEAALVRSLNAQIAADGDDAEDAARQLACLPGEDAVRAKVRWLVENDDDVSRVMADGLAASANLPLQLELLQKIWSDPGRAPNGEVLAAMDVTRAFMKRRTLPGWQMTVALTNDEAARNAAEQRRADLNLILSTLPQRSGQNRTETAYFLMEMNRLDEQQAAVVKPVVLAEFAHMEPLAQAMLLETRWKEVRDPSLVPALRAMLEHPDDDGFEDALERLIELDPKLARPYLAAAVCNAKHTPPLDKVKAFPAESLPEVDGCLAKMVAPGGLPENSRFLKDSKLELAGRFATAEGVATIRKELPEATASAPRFALEMRGDPKAAVALLRANPGLLQTEMFSVNRLFAARQAGFPPEFLEYLREELGSANLPRVEQAAYELQVGGEASDRERLVTRFRELSRVQAERTPITTILEERQRVEAQLMGSIRQGRAWYTLNDEAARLAELCSSEACHNWGNPRQPDAPFADN